MKNAVFIAAFLILVGGTFYTFVTSETAPVSVHAISSTNSGQQHSTSSATIALRATTTITATEKEMVATMPAPITAAPPTKSAETQMQAAVVPEGWKMYSYEGYAVAFPSDPRITNYETDAGSGLKMTIVTYAALADNGAAYFLSVTAIPKEIVIYDSRKLLDNAVNATVSQVGGELAFKMDTSALTGKDSEDFMVHIPDGPRTYAARNIYKDNKLYELRVVYISEKSGDFKGLADSFKFQ